MRLWSGIITRLMTGIAKWKIWYAAVFSIIGIVANSIPIFLPATRHMNSSSLTQADIYIYIIGLLYGLLSVAAIPILGWVLYKRIRSGRRQIRIPAALRRQFPLQFRLSYGVSRVLLFVVVVPALSLTLFGFVGLINYLISPDFASNQQSVNAGQNYLLGAGMALLASLEELWRWSMIITAMYGLRWVFKRRWYHSKRFRRAAFLLSILLSSFFFGLAHVAEFPSHYQGMALFVLGLMGLILAGVAILTRRLWVAMFIHALYDFLAMTNLAGAVGPWVAAVSVAGLLFAVPIFYRGLVAIQARTRPYV